MKLALKRAYAGWDRSCIFYGQRFCFGFCAGRFLGFEKHYKWAGGFDWHMGEEKKFEIDETLRALHFRLLYLGRNPVFGERNERCVVVLGEDFWMSRRKL